MMEEKEKMEQELSRVLYSARPSVAYDQNFKTELGNLLDERAGQVKGEKALRGNRSFGVPTFMQRYAVGVGGAVFVFLLAAGAVYYQVQNKNGQIEERAGDVAVESFSLSAPAVAPVAAPRAALDTPPEPAFAKYKSVIAISIVIVLIAATAIILGKKKKKWKNM